VKGISNPKLVVRRLNRLYHTRFYKREKYPDGVDIPTEDWDNLIILDACRYDVFEEVANLKGDLQSRYSRASMTVEFLRSNFHNRDLTDTVYVTANPMPYRVDEISLNFHDIINVWKDDGWDSRHHTVLPETMIEYGLEAAKTYPNKRIIFHFLQPHFPFITDETEFDKQTPDPSEDDTRQFWHQLFLGDLSISRETVREAYKDNLRAAIKPVKELLTTLQGKNIVTSDHGNMIGESSAPIPIKEWGHPKYTYTEELLRVPWLVYENGERKRISPDEPGRKEAVADDVVTNRLEDLGYKTT
jgi:hypothetical protein